ncbi:MAG: EamA/RhaT family transporter [Ruminococcaceae bacterium]|nr:EamA/RhaT family transporter [Oscillospiraceae bacterium]
MDINRNNGKNSAKLARGALILSMSVFGTIGLFRRLIPLPSGAIAFFRGLIGTLALLLIVLISRKKLDLRAIKKHLILLCLSGALIGFNWIFLFEAYNYTSVATATLCYYTAPIIVLIAAPFIFKERFGIKQGLCAACALIGMVFVSGVLNGGKIAVKGIIFGLLSALLYASVILINRGLGALSAYDKTIIQLASAAIVILPYTLIAEDIPLYVFNLKTVILLLVVGIIHTGISYALYFNSVGSLPTQSVAICSYIDPVVAIILSALVLKEPMGVWEIVGAVLILGAAVACELPSKRIKK